jgi:FkbM family methyltransferase
VKLHLVTPYEAMVWLGYEEHDEIDWLRQTLRPGDVFVDCGANIGLWTLVAATTVAPNGRVIAVEPNPVTAGRLEEHVSRNRLERTVTVLTAALGERSGSARLVPGEHHNVTRVAAGPGEGFSVDVLSLDSAVEDCARVDGVKLDVEGSELDVIRGANQTLATHRPWIVVEFNTLVSAVRRPVDWSVHRHLTALGYRLQPLGQHPLTDTTEFAGYVNLLYVAAQG